MHALAGNAKHAAFARPPAHGGETPRLAPRCAALAAAAGISGCRKSDGVACRRRTHGRQDHGVVDHLRREWPNDPNGHRVHVELTSLAESHVVQRGGGTVSHQPERLRELASWYREYAERTSNPAIWDARIRTAEDLEAEATRLECLMEIEA